MCGKPKKSKEIEVEVIDSEEMPSISQRIFAMNVWRSGKVAIETTQLV